MQTHEGLPLTAAQRWGDWLFRHRSYTLAPLALLIAAAVWFGSPPTGAFRWAQWLVWGAAVALLVLGETLRFFVAGRALPGTSGRGATLRAATLITSGPYGWTRNPLYLANGLLWLGAGLLTLNAWLVAVVVVVISLQYHLIVLAEERFLVERFGQAYSDYCRAVPRSFPSMGRALQCFTLSCLRERVTAQRSGEGGLSSVSFDWPKALFREHDTIYLVFLAIWLVLSRQTSLAALGAWCALLGAATLLWLTTKWIKKTRRRRVTDYCSGTLKATPSE